MHAAVVADAGAKEVAAAAARSSVGHETDAAALDPHFSSLTGVCLSDTFSNEWPTGLQVKVDAAELEDVVVLC
jgi:hypothetical protein